MKEIHSKKLTEENKQDEICTTISLVIYLLFKKFYHGFWVIYYWAPRDRWMEEDEDATLGLVPMPATGRDRSSVLRRLFSIISLFQSKESPFPIKSLTLDSG